MHSTLINDTVVYRNALPPATALMEYRLEGVLGAGGFGITYAAWDAHLQKRVAIKEYLPADIALRALDGSIVPVATQRQDDYRWGLERFLLEARTLARFSHPHIVRVNRYFEANNTGYMVMDYEQGESMSRFLKREPYPAEARLREILLPLLEGLRAVHEAGFLHRDIKPSNIFIREQGGPVLLDFGAARDAVGGSGGHTALLTPGYAPVEQYSGASEQGPWTDIYAVAGVFFRAVTNANPPDAVGRIRRDTVPEMLSTARGRYSDGLLAAIGWALETDEQRRPQSVAEWQDGLLGRTPVPFEPGAQADLEERQTRRLAVSRADHYIDLGMAVRRFAWLVPVGVALVAVAALVTRPRGPEPERTPVVAPAAMQPTAPPESPVERAAAPAKPKPMPKTARVERPPPTVREPRVTLPPSVPVDRTLPEAATVTTAEERVDDGRAPVRDAVPLPPLADVARDRPGRERSARPGSER